MKKCLITGATGLIGKATLELMKENWTIYSVGINKSSQNDFTINCNFSFPFCTENFPEEVDAVIHLAQSKHFRDFPEYAEDIFNVNVASTIKLLDYARKAKAKTFILASSGGIYGNGDEGFKEDEIIKAQGDLGFYLSTKLCMELLAENYSSYMNVIILRFFFVYGPGQRNDMLIPRLVQSVQDGKKILLHGNDGIKINPTYVTDAAEAIVSAINLEGSHKINVGGPEIVSLRQIGEVIGKILGKKPIFELVDIAPKHIIGDIEKMSRLLGKPRVTFETGIKKLLSN